MIKKATSGMLVMLLLSGMFYMPFAKAQTASPAQAVITVSDVPTGTQGLAVEVTVDTTVVTLGSATSSVSGALAVTGSMSEGVGVISTSGDLPTSFTITVPLTGVAAGTSMFAVGNVLDKIGGTAITGASAMADTSSVTVASSSTSTSTSSTSSTGGAGGKLSADTITITVNGQAVAETSALNVTLSFSDPTVATLDTGVTFMGTGASQLLTDVDATKNVLTAVWSGSITDSAAVLTAMLKPGSKAGTTMISVSKVEAAGGTDVTGSVAATVDPSSVTNGASSSSTSSGVTFSFIGPTEVTGPGKAAFAVSVSGTKPSSATINGAKVNFVSSDVGIAIVTVPASGKLSLSLTAAGMATALGDVTVNAGEGKKPKVTSASAQNKSSKTTLKVAGRKFSKEETTVEIVPTDRESTAVKVTKGKAIKATYASSECIPKGSYVNVSTPGGVGAANIKVRGSCSNKLVE